MEENNDNDEDIAALTKVGMDLKAKWLAQVQEELEDCVLQRDTIAAVTNNTKIDKRRRAESSVAIFRALKAKVNAIKIPFVTDNSTPAQFSKALTFVELDQESRAEFWDDLFNDDVLYTVWHFAAGVIDLYATLHQEGGEGAAFFYQVFRSLWEDSYFLVIAPRLMLALSLAHHEENIRRMTYSPADPRQVYENLRCLHERALTQLPGIDLMLLPEASEPPSVKKKMATSVKKKVTPRPDSLPLVDPEKLKRKLESRKGAGGSQRKIIKISPLVLKPIILS